MRFNEMVKRLQILRPRPSRDTHELRCELVVSLTSYPPRFKTLRLTVESLLRQSVLPNRLVLWIADKDYELIPQDVLDLVPIGLEIRRCEDLRSYKKIVPALKEFPRAAIIIADDDVYYERHWLRDFCSQYTDEGVALCQRAHMVKLNEAGRPASYAEWRKDIAPACSELVFPTGVGGVLYPPNSLPAATLDAAEFTKYCPEGDDIWLYWMARMNGVKFRRIERHQDFIEWQAASATALWRRNVEGGNDEQIAAMVAAYGWPPRCDHD